MFVEHLDFCLYRWDAPDPETGNKGEIYVIDQTIEKNVSAKTYLYEQQQPQPNSNNWNFGSVPPSLLKKSG
jgi:hypothetical protein